MQMNASVCAKTADCQNSVRHAFWDIHNRLCIASMY